MIARYLEAVMPGDASLPAWAWVAGPVVLLAAVALASVVPARRALMADPLTIMGDN